MPAIPIGAGGVQYVPPVRARRGGDAADILRMLMEQDDRRGPQMDMQTMALLAPILQAQVGREQIAASERMAREDRNLTSEQFRQQGALTAAGFQNVLDQMRINAKAQEAVAQTGKETTLGAAEIGASATGNAALIQSVPQLVETITSGSAADKALALGIANAMREAQRQAAEIGINRAETKLSLTEAEESKKIARNLQREQEAYTQWSGRAGRALDAVDSIKSLPAFDTFWRAEDDFGKPEGPIGKATYANYDKVERFIKSVERTANQEGDSPDKLAAMRILQDIGPVLSEELASIPRDWLEGSGIEGWLLSLAGGTGRSKRHDSLSAQLAELLTKARSPGGQTYLADAESRLMTTPRLEEARTKLMTGLDELDPQAARINADFFNILNSIATEKTGPDVNALFQQLLNKYQPPGPSGGP